MICGKDILYLQRGKRAGGRSGRAPKKWMSVGPFSMFRHPLAQTGKKFKAEL